MIQPKYFCKSLDQLAKEVLPKVYYEHYGVAGLQQMDERVLITLDNLSKNLEIEYGRKIALTVNSWSWGGNRNQSGLRTREFYNSESDYVSSRSQHKYGRGCDLVAKGLTPHDVRKHVIENKDKYPDISFLEVGPLKDGSAMSWVHFDVRMRLDNDAIKYWSPKLKYVSEEVVLKDEL